MRLLPGEGDLSSSQRTWVRLNREGRQVAFFIGIACPWILVIVLDRIAEERRASELEALGVVPAKGAGQSSYITKPDRPY